MSTPGDRLELVSSVYHTALARRPADLRLAKTPEDARAVMANVDALEAKYLDAVAAALNANGPDIEAAYQAAKDASDAVEKAYAQGQQLAARIKAVAGVVTALGTLITKASAAV